MDLNGNIIDCNEQLTEILEYKKDFFIGNNFFKLDFYPSGALQFVKEEYEEFLIKGHTFPSEFQIEKKGGEVIWISLAADFITYNGSRAIQAVLFDISHRKDREEKLKELSTITKKTTDAIVKTNKQFQINYMNPAAEKLFGWSLKEVEGKTPIIFNAESNKERLEQELFNRISSGEVYKNVLLNVKKNGTLFYNECRVSPLINDEGEIYGYIGSHRDVTERVKSQKRVEESERKYRRIAEILPAAIFETDIEGNITFANSAGFQIFGYSSKELEENMNLFELITDKYKDKVERRHKQVLDGKLPKPVEILMMKKNGEKFYARINSRPVYENNEISGLITIISNIHESVIAKQKIKKSEKELKRLNKLKSQLLRRTSHELKTPLISIKGFSNLLLKLQTENLNKKSIEYTWEIRKGCERLENLINKILDATKIDSNNLRIEKRKYNLTKLVDLAVKALKGAIKERNHSITVNLHKKMNIKADKEKILQVIENLISNAIKYTPSNGQISISSELKDGVYIISVIDNGIGFTSKEKENLFSQFGKIERFGKGFDIKSEGSGLGLYISKKLVELHGGDLWMESEGRNQGTTFYFSLPKYGY